MITTTAPDASPGESGCDESSSDGSVIRVPIDNGEEEDGYSSGGSVIRMNVDAGSPYGTPVGSRADEDDGCSSDGSVVRVPARKAGCQNDVDESQRRPGGNGNPVANELGLKRQPDHQDGITNGVGSGTVGQLPRHMEMNLLAASKYFGSKGGASDDGGAATATEASPHVSQKAKENPQVDPARDVFFC